MSDSATPSGTGHPPGDPPKNKLSDPCYVNAMAHFYRGELGRIMMWRSRLDTTTTWAITSTTTIFTVAFSFREMPHIIFFFNLCIITIMLWIEARRYRFYDAFRARVRMLEAHFLVPMMLQNPNLLTGEWEKLVCEDLYLPAFKISKLEAVGRRLKRNYIFIYLTILVAWLTKIFMHSKAPIHNLTDFYAALAVSGLHSWVVALLFGSTLLSVTVLTIHVAHTTYGEVGEMGGHRTSWRL